LVSGCSRPSTPIRRAVTRSTARGHLGMESIFLEEIVERRADMAFLFHLVGHQNLPL
jgi:hypothetical protein